MVILDFTGDCGVCTNHIFRGVIYKDEVAIKGLVVCDACARLLYWDKMLRDLNSMEW
jgi:predicted  nucleic acid-binding Zn-ribbon protein